MGCTLPYGNSDNIIPEFFFENKTFVDAYIERTKIDQAANGQ